MVLTRAIGGVNNPLTRGVTFKFVVNHGSDKGDRWGQQRPFYYSICYPRTQATTSDVILLDRTLLDWASIQWTQGPRSLNPVVLLDCSSRNRKVEANFPLTVNVSNIQQLSGYYRGSSSSSSFTWLTWSKACLRGSFSVTPSHCLRH